MSVVKDAVVTGFLFVPQGPLTVTLLYAASTGQGFILLYREENLKTY